MDNTLMLSQITLGAVSAFFLQVLKKASWFPVLHEDSEKFVKVLFGLITSAAAITGLSYTYDPTAHTLLIMNFSWTMVLHASWHWLQQFVVQEGWYQIAFNKPKNGNGNPSQLNPPITTGGLGIPGIVQEKKV